MENNTSVSALPIVSLRDYRIRWKILLSFVFLHVGACLAPFYFSFSALLWAIGFWVITGMFGICVGYHRLIAHRSFEASAVVRAFHLLCGALAFQQGPMSWARIHRAHHANSDTASDPHPQHLGIFFGHIGWAFLSPPRTGRSELRRVRDPDLTSDKVILFF